MCPPFCYAPKGSMHGSPTMLWGIPGPLVMALLLQNVMAYLSPPGKTAGNLACVYPAFDSNLDSTGLTHLMHTL